MRLILASASPRRAELLRRAGYPFDVAPANVDEQALEDERPLDYVRRVALAKARAVVRPGDTVLAADTAVVVDGAILGKPSDDADAARMLNLLSGREHLVLTAVALARDGREVVAVESTAVTFRELSAEDVAAYVASGEPHDKAGAYAVQGLAARFVTGIRGSYANVVGLPVERVPDLLAALGGSAEAEAACRLDRAADGGPARD